MKAYTRVSRWLLLLSVLALLALWGWHRAAAAPTPAAPTSTWCAAGSFQGWDNSANPLYDDGTHGDLLADDGVFSLDFTIAAADRYEWKAVTCGDWGTTFPSQNSWFYTGSPNQVVHLTFDTNDHAGDALPASPAQNIVNVSGDDLPVSFTAVGDWQGWDNSNPATLMSDAGNGIHALQYDIATAGTYQAKIVQTGSWSEQFVQDGRAVDGTPLSFTTGADNERVSFLLDTHNGRVTIAGNGSGSGSWCLAGGFQGWDNSSTPLNDDGLDGDLVGGDGVFSLDYTLTNAGRDEFKVVECGNWGNAYPSNNAWVITSAANQVVKFTFDTNDHSGDVVALMPAQNIVNAWDDAPATWTAVGDWQGWDNTNPDTALTDVGNGWYMVQYEVANAGTYQAKISETNNWSNQFSADGRNDSAPFNFQTLGDNLTITILLDINSGRWNILVPEPEGGASHDDNIFWDDLGHDSRDPLYRAPGGPVTTNTPVTLRLRAASNDLTAAKVRVWDDRNNVNMLLPMTLAADDGTYEWWEITLPGSADPTIYWYRFIAIDGTATAYYEDDSARTGGWGETFGDSPDNSWQLTVYDPTFTTPDWVKNAVIYQIFADRFRDGDAGNDTTAGTFFYDQADGSIYRSNQADWNTPVCDPRAEGTDCTGKYSENFYGGDLQGVLDKLDYLQDLGVTAIYLNPIFESPSNHKYDTTDYGLIDDNFGDLALFQQLVTEAHNRGMKIILDGVFNHTSSDSIFFDRYDRYPAPDGACESETSPYRDWYYFSAAPVPGSGVCAGDTNYTSWFGFDSLPKLDSANTDVRDYIWSGGESAIARYWMQWADGWRLDVGGDVDPGTANDPTNDYWEGFRQAIHETNPQAYIVGEEWGNGSSWFIGNEWDGTMNYQYSSAMLSFWRDTTFTDNDHNSGSSAGTLAPLTPSQLDERLRNWQERYPPEAYYAEMNLLGSHDTNRALIMLDEGPGKNDAALYDDPNYDWSDAMDRLKGVILLQFTLPGAPTIYYGDEVGLVGPVTNDGTTLQDDPYNRIPYPWLDESGTPFYTHLQTEVGQANPRDRYTLLANTRQTHAALRTGSFDTLLVDDANNIYAYGRKMADNSDAAVIIANRGATAAAVTVDVSGYLSYGATFIDVLNGDAAYTVDGSGQLTVDVPAFSGSLLVLTNTLGAAPDAVADLAVTGEASETVDLGWSAAAGASSYDVYRGLVSGGGYAWVANVAGTAYTDTGLLNAIPYYYVVVSRDDATGLVSGWSNEAMGIPHHDLDAAWYNLQWPPQITHTISALTPTENIYGQLYIANATGGSGPATGIWAQVGYGPTGTSATGADWSWTTMDYNTAVGNNDEYLGNLLPDMQGAFDYVTRWSGDGGRSWYYADLNGPGENGNPGRLYVVPSDDTTAPAAPQNLTLVGTTASSVILSWDANTESDLVGYELYRRVLVGAALVDYERVAVLDAGITGYTDEDVVTDTTYEYYLLAYDTSFNRSEASNVVQATAETRYVTVTFRVGVPDYTPGVVHVSGDLPEFGPWDAGKVAMTEVSPNVWEYTTSILDGTQLQYKFTRGTWETVESWGSIVGFANRAATIEYGTDGTQLIDNTATDWISGDDADKAVRFWRDPIVVSHYPTADAIGVPLDTVISVTWSITMTADTMFTVNGPDGTVSGTFSYDADAWMVTFAPDLELALGSVYTVSVAGQTTPGVPGGDTGVQQVPVTWSFTTVDAPTSVELVGIDGAGGNWWNGWIVAMVLVIGGSILGLLELWRRGWLFAGRRARRARPQMG